ncbi:MAG: PQQ-dependent sugar dehydrogenase [Puniceicoccaceae bacterium]
MLSSVRWAGLLSVAAAAQAPAEAAARIEELYNSHCVNCHGDGMAGGSAPSMLDDEWRYGSGDEVLADVIRAGRPGDGMPAFGEVLSEEEIRAMVIFIREKNARARPEPAPEAIGDRVFRSELHDFRLETVVDELDLPWSLAFLPGGDWLVSERAGTLLRIDPETGARQTIEGIPEVFAKGQGGLLDVAVHPGHAENGWVYLSYSDPSPGGRRGFTAIARGRLDGDRWVDEEVVFQVPDEFYGRSGVHFGCRMVFDGDHLFFTIGDRGRQEQARDLSRPNGKTHRIFHDGRIPPDNPFADEPDAFPSIWTIGNRNAQGLALDPSSGHLWETEHGPRGGDELNLLRGGADYGWPFVTFGMNYNGTPITDRTSAPGIVDPVVHWTPSPAVCGLDFYDADAFPRWRGALLSGALAGQELRLLRLDGESVAGQEILVKGMGRIRDVEVGPGGLVYIVFNGPGRIVRMSPAD